MLRHLDSEALEVVQGLARQREDDVPVDHEVLGAGRSFRAQPQQSAAQDLELALDYGAIHACLRCSIVRCA